LSELKDWLGRNGQQLEEAVGKNLTDLQKHIVGFHGTSQEGMEGLNRDQKHKGDYLFVATMSHAFNDSKEWIAGVGRSIEKAVDYVKPGGGIAVVDLGKNRPWPSGEYPGVTPHSHEGPEQEQAAKNPFIQPGKWGEKATHVNPENFAETIRGWMDPSKWPGLSQKDAPPGEATERNNIAKAFERQGMIQEALRIIGIPIGNGPAEKGAGAQGGDDFITISPIEQYPGGGPPGGKPVQPPGGGAGGRGVETPVGGGEVPPPGKGNNEPTYSFDDPNPGGYPPGGQSGDNGRPRLQPAMEKQPVDPPPPQMQLEPDRGGHSQPPMEKDKGDKPGRPGGGGEEGEWPGVERVRNPLMPPGLEGMKKDQSGSDTPDSVRARDVDSAVPLPGGSTMYKYHGELTEKGPDGKQPVKFESTVVMGPDGKTVQGAQTNYDSPTDITFAGTGEKANRKVIEEHENKVEIKGVTNVATMQNPDGSYHTIVTGQEGSYIFEMDKNQKITKVVGPDGKEVT
jgi:hypothetical protein